MSEQRWKEEAVFQAAWRKRIYDEAYPDVGWGQSWGGAVAESLGELGLTTADVDMKALLAREPKRSAL